MSKDQYQATIRDLKSYVKWLQRERLEIDSGELHGALALTNKHMRQEPLNSTRSASHDADADANSAGMESIAAQVAACRACSLGQSRKNPVWGTGNVHAKLMFIGEAPGATEDEKGLPFIGPAGKILTQELAKNGIAREDVFITNIIKCRPPGNRDPLPEEIRACEHFLLGQIDLIKPAMLCALGRFAAMTLLNHPISIMRIRGTWESYHGVPLFICLHPSATLHQPANRPLFDGDIAALAKRYHEAN